MIDSLLAHLKEFTSQHQLFKAFKTFALIQIHAPSPSCDIISQSVSALLSPCTDLRLLSQGKQLHSCAISFGVERHFALVLRLVSFYSNLNLLVDAHSATENSNTSNPTPWNLLISAYVRNGLCGEALSAYKQMLSKRIQGDNFTYPRVLRACAEKGDLDFGREVHKSIVDGCLKPNLFVQNALVSMYAKCGEVGLAHDLFKMMSEKDLASWNSMISGYTSKGMWKNALELLGFMRSEGVDMSMVDWKTLARGCFRAGIFCGVLELLYKMGACGIQFDYSTIMIGLSAISHIGAVKAGGQLHALTVSYGFSNVRSIQNTLITMYSRLGDLVHAHLLFQSMESRNLISWNSMISGYAQTDCSDETLCLLREMLVHRVEPDYVTIACVLPLCARVADLQHGKEFHCYITRHEGLRDYLLLWNSLVDMYARSGRIKDARRVFDMLAEKDEVTYTAMIAGYGMQGQGRIALGLFELMNLSGIRPDHVTMVAVLAACSHSGLVSEGEKVFQTMQAIHGVSPRLEHFACMVDLFSRAGLLDKARDVLSQTPFRPTPMIWATLLGACLVHRNPKMGEWAAKRLLEVGSSHPGHLMLIANAYGASELWSEFASVRARLKGLRLRKPPGRAWIDVGLGFEAFVAGDVSNAQSIGIYGLLVALSEVMRDAGYVASGDFLADECGEAYCSDKAKFMSR